MRFSPKRLLFVLSLALGLVYSAPLFAYEEIPVDKGGELFGTIKFKGEAPVNQPHKVTHNPDFCGESVKDETYLVNPANKGLENVVISFEGIERGKKYEHTTIVLENLKCHFVPHVLAGVVGDSYEIRNSDPVLHNTHLRMEGITILNVAMPPNGKNIKKPMLQAGMIKTKCDAHTFMNGTILVMNNPYFAITGKDGSYRITEIPPGKYKLKIWHEGLPIKEKEVVIQPHEKINLSLDLGL